MLKFKIELTPENLQVIDAALSELPYRVSAPVIAEINSQLEEQQKEIKGRQE